MDPRGERILVTGGAGFIGSTLIRRIIDHNQVVILDTFGRDALQYHPGLAEHPHLTVMRGSVLDPEAVERAMDGATMVVHCAAVAGIDSVGVHPTRTMRINVEGAANLFAAVLPAMLERHQGQLVGVSSIARWRGLPRSGSYSASKAALTTLMESMRLELRAEGIAVTAVHPGFVVTPMTEKNAFRMPFLMDVDKAARVTTRGILERRRDVNYPRAMVLAVQLSRLMPNWLYDRLMGGKAGWTLKPEGKRPR